MQIAIWFALTVVSYFLSAAMAPKPQTPQPATFQDFDFPQADEGTPECVLFGDCWTTDWVVVGLGNYRSEAIKSSSGKK